MEEEAMEFVRMTLEQPVAVRARFREIVCFLGNKLVPRQELAPFAAELANSETEGHLREKWLLQRILALILHCLIQVSMGGCIVIFVLRERQEEDTDIYETEDNLHSLEDSGLR